MTDNVISTAFTAVVELAIALGVHRADQLPGLWEYTVDEQWRVRLNPHDDERERIPPFHVAIEFNGWPAGLVSPGGGVIAAGEAANEEAFIVAVVAATERAKQRTGVGISDG